MANDFNDIFEELTWAMCKMSEGNPYIFQDLVKERNVRREKDFEAQQPKIER